MMKKLVVLVIISMLLVGCSTGKALHKSDEDLKRDLVGETIGVVTLTDDSIKEIVPIKESIEKERGMIVINLKLEHLIPHSGSLNKDVRKNDVLHSIEGQVTLNYMKKDNEWVYSGLSNYQQTSYKKEEIENLMERIEFNKTTEEVLKDLKDKNMGIKVVDNHVHTITFGQNDMLGYIPITELVSFDITDIKTSETNDLITEVSSYIDVEYKVENSIFDDNGTYHVKGNVDILYKLEYNELQEEEWVIYQVKELKLQ